MTRRLALILALLSPLAGSAQTAGNVTILPAAFGVDDCTVSDKYVGISWMTTVTPVTGDVYRVYINTTGCSSSAMTTGQLGSDITPEATSATTPQVLTSPPTRMDFLVTEAGITDCAVTGPTIKVYVCVQQVGTTGTIVRATMNGSAQLYREPPPVPVSVTVAPGDTALYASWADGTANGVAAASYEVTAVADSPANPADTHTQAFTGKTNNRVTGLTNGVTYAVTVRSVSAGSNRSAWTAAVLGTPAQVMGFWDEYTKANGREQGGCGGGPAGLVSLLGVALALRGLRRKS
jgi:hypothetical protein